VPFRPGALARQIDKFRPLLRRQFGQEREGRRCQFSPEGAPLFPGLIKQLHDFRIIRVGLGELGPSFSDQWLDRLVHRLHPRMHGSSVLVEGCLLLSA